MLGIIVAIGTGLVIGSLSGLVGIGGGILLMPLLLYVFRTDIHTAAGTSLAIVIPTAIAGGVVHLTKGNINWHLTLIIAAGAVLGSIAGAWLGNRLPAATLQRAFAVLLVLALFRPAQDAANSRFPIGGAHGAYNGLDALVDYIRGHLPGNAVLYHRWLGWHYSFYLFDFPYLLQWYTSPDELVTDAVERPGIPRYVAFPSWQSPTQTRWVLRRSGLDMNPLYETYRDNGTRSFTLYRIEEAVTDG